MTGLPGAGKTTLANALSAWLRGQSIACYVLDGDLVRRSLCSDLGFTDADRSENCRRLAHVASMLFDAGVLGVVAAVTPFRADRAQARQILGADRFIEVHVATPLDVTSGEDVKGMYKRALAGELPLFTGVGAVYEAPASPDIRADRASTPAQSCARIIELMRTRGWID